MRRPASATCAEGASGRAMSSEAARWQDLSVGPRAGKAPAVICARVCVHRLSQANHHFVELGARTRRRRGSVADLAAGAPLVLVKWPGDELAGSTPGLPTYTYVVTRSLLPTPYPLNPAQRGARGHCPPAAAVARRAHAVPCRESCVALLAVVTATFQVDGGRVDG